MLVKFGLALSREKLFYLARSELVRMGVIWLPKKRLSIQNLNAQLKARFRQTSFVIKLLCNSRLRDTKKEYSIANTELMFV
jgi:hypothetical protein